MNIAKALALNGAQKVYITGRNLDKLEAAARSSPHGNIIPIPGDVTSKDDLTSIASRIRNEMGYLDLLVANAGMGGPGPHFASPRDRAPMTAEEFQAKALEATVEQWDECFRLNVTGTWFTIVTCLDLLAAGNEKSPYAKQGIKSQVLITSAVGAYLRGYISGYPSRASKAGVAHLGKVLSSTFAEFGIRVNTLAPGMFPSPPAMPMMKRFAKWSETEPEKLDKYFIPEQRFGTDEDIAGTVLYLASRAGAYNNGNVNVLDGGLIGQMPATY